MTTIALILLLAQVGLMAAILQLRCLENKKLFKTNRPLTPISSKGIIL